MKCKDGNSEREYQNRIESLRKNVFNTQLQPLRSLETATKKRRALKKKAQGRLPANGAPGRAFYEMTLHRFQILRPPQSRLR